jgi:GT2 family glycosyltransferase
MQKEVCSRLFGAPVNQVWGGRYNRLSKIGLSTLPAAQDYMYEASVIIVSFNTKAVLRECLESVARESDGLQIETLVVDNDSTDGSPELVEHEFPWVRVLRSSVNLGFGAANNLAIRAAQGRYIILLNSDAFLCPGSLRTALNNMNLHPAVALAGARLVGRDFSWQPSARMFPSVLNEALVLTGLAAKFPKSRFFGRFDKTWADPSEPTQIDWVPGAFSIIRTTVLDEVGLFDPRFFMYSEEVDLCRRIKRAGYKIWYWPDIQVIHIGGESSRQIKDLELSSSGSTQLILWRMRSTLLYSRKHHGTKVWLTKWLELAFYRLSYIRNRFSSDPLRRGSRVTKSQSLATSMILAWKETKGGRVSPPRPW